MVILSRSSNTRILCMYKVLAYFPSIFILHILWRWYSFIFLIDFLLLGFWLDMYIFFSYSYSKLDDIKSHIQYCTNDDAPQKIDYGKVYPEEVIYDLVIHIYRCTYTYTHIIRTYIHIDMCCYKFISMYRKQKEIL